MAFSDDVVERAWKRAKGCCECRRITHNNHSGRCDEKLDWLNRGRDGHGAWEAHHINSNGGDILSNCEILCWACHSQTL